MSLGSLALTATPTAIGAGRRPSRDIGSQQVTTILPNCSFMDQGTALRAVRARRAGWRQAAPVSLRHRGGKPPTPAGDRAQDPGAVTIASVVARSSTTGDRLPHRLRRLATESAGCSRRRPAGPSMGHKPVSAEATPGHSDRL
jgi:hypothetical protein